MARRCENCRHWTAVPAGLEVDGFDHFCASDVVPIPMPAPAHPPNAVAVQLLLRGAPWGQRLYTLPKFTCAWQAMV
jgi:hypothetical protein